MQKRPRVLSSPTLTTPVRAQKRTPLLEIVDEVGETNVDATLQLTFDCDESRGVNWSNAELQALVEFILLHGTGNHWPTHHRMDYWSSAASFVKTRSNAKPLRSGNACRFKVVGYLKKRFSTPKDAESDLFSANIVPSNRFVECGIQTDVCLMDGENINAIICDQLVNGMRLEALSPVFSLLCGKELGLVVPEDFLKFAVSAMQQLALNGRSNVLYNLAKGIGTIRNDHSDSCFPIKRMPMGLFEYACNFFVSENMNKVPSCPNDYRLWQQTMYCQFGQKWAKLHHGPMWSVSSLGTSNDHFRKEIDKCLVNVPGLSESTLRRDLASSGISLGSQIQFSVLEEAARSHPDTWWWVKADGTDLVSGLGESVSGEWSGDIDLNDGKLKQMYMAYRKRLDFISSINGEEEEDIQLLRQQIVQDVDFVTSTLKKFNDEYQAKLKEKVRSEKVMMQLAWNVKDLGDLNEHGRKIINESDEIKQKMHDSTYDKVVNNFAKKLSSFRESAKEFVKRVTKYKRISATHILVVMISPEERSSKPYALPIQCIPYKSLKDSEVRQIANRIVKEMVSRKMKVAGFTTNGEWNSLRSKGNTRPLSVFEICSKVRNKYARLKQKTLLGMLTPKRDVRGMVVAEIPNPAVTDEILEEIWKWREEGCMEQDVIVRLRNRVVPVGYEYHNWHTGKSETNADMMRSVLAQLDYSFQINQWHSKGVPFKTHLHVPEEHPETGTIFCEREDEGHVLKRIGNSLRQGSVKNIRLERFAEALEEPSAGLTYPALTGVRKQSVEDVERLFGQSVINFMKKKGYENEAIYLQKVRNWRRSIDERGLSEEERQKYLEEFLNFIIEDLIPWQSVETKDFSLMEVNRPLNNVQGFTRETLIALAADLETRMYRYKFNLARSIPIEHPRSSTTDDVECFFSILRETVGKDFTLKQVYYGWRKVSLEFIKRIDPELPFFYYTTAHSRYYKEEMPNFNQPPMKPKKPKRPPNNELIACIGPRVSLPVRGSLSTRATFHNLPVSLPPLPGASAASLVTSEHSYSSKNTT